ncbi:MAG TPA: glycoside hydrolase family 88 protein [Terracidiphilus sp.]
MKNEANKTSRPSRRTFLGAAVAFGAQGAMVRAAGAASPAGGAPSESVERIARARRAALTLQRKDWEQGILAQALLESGDREGVILLTRGAMVQQTADGRMGVVVSGGATDAAMGGAAYAQAAEWTGEPAMKEAVARLTEWIRVKAPRAADGTISHVMESVEMWSDGLNGAPPFLAAVGFYDEALRQIEGYKRRLWNPEKKLLAHIWDERKGALTDGSFWGGGNGWAAAGLARVWRSLPVSRSAERAQVAGFARELIDGCLRYQRADWLFHNVIDRPESFVETNLAQMLAYAVYEGVRAGWLGPEYRARADRMRAAARAKMDAEGFVQGVCGAPEFAQPGISTEAQAFAILMETAGDRQGVGSKE